jgi:hypothetical protein
MASYTIPEILDEEAHVKGRLTGRPFRIEGRTFPPLNDEERQSLLAQLAMIRNELARRKLESQEPF